MAFSPYLISGDLPFSGGGNPFSGDPASAYASAYNAALQMNAQNYANIMAGYQGLSQSQASQQNQIMAGYTNLQGQVLGDLSNAGASEKQAIIDQYVADRGQASQQLINRGLGNTTVRNSIDRGLMAQRDKANVALSEQIGNLLASYRSNLGLAGLNYQNQANMQNTNLGLSQLGFMNSVQAPYPDASPYVQMAMLNAQAKRGLLGGLGGRASYQSSAPGGGSQWSPWPSQISPYLGYQVAGGGGGGYGTLTNTTGYAAPETIYGTQYDQPYQAPIDTPYTDYTQSYGGGQLSDYSYGPDLGYSSPGPELSDYGYGPEF